MNHCGFDLGKKSSYYCVVDEDRVVVNEGKVRNRPRDIDRRFGGRPSMHFVIEASGKAFWVADHLRDLGHSVTVCDPSRTKAIGAARIKHDRLDARVLAELGQAGLLPAVDCPSQPERIRRMPLTARDRLVRVRGQVATCVRSIADGEGVILPPCAPERLPAVTRQHDLPEGMVGALEPLLESIEQVSEQIRGYDKDIKARANDDPAIRLLMTCPGVGPQVATAFVYKVRDPSRFSSGRQLAAYLGLVPSLYASGQTYRRGGITKRGDPQVRWLLCMAANAVLTRSKGDFALRRWALSLNRRLGGKKARVAVARKLAMVLWAMWRDGRAFEDRAG